MLSTVILKERGINQEFCMGFAKSARKIFEFFTPQTNGELSDSLIQNWTPQAIECYEAGKDCSKCSISRGNYSFVCQMPKVVDKLLQDYGEPPQKIIRIF